MRVPLYEQNERDEIGGTELIKERDKGTGGGNAQFVRLGLVRCMHAYIFLPRSGIDRKAM